MRWCKIVPNDIRIKFTWITQKSSYLTIVNIQLIVKMFGTVLVTSCFSLVV